jgi:hypothetical protein
MSLHTQGISVPASTVLGHRKDGRPIFPIAGGAPQPGEGGDPVIVVPAAVVEPPATPPAEPRFTVEDIQKARQEEKDKLYKRLQSVEEQNKTFLAEIEEQRKAREAAQAQESERQRQAQEAAKAKAEEDMSAKELLAVKEQEWNQRLQQFEKERLLFQKEQEFNSLQSYIQRRVGEESENIAPELLDFVGGNTPEEVENSLNTVKAKTQAILESVQQAAIQQRASMRGVSPTGYSTTGPMDTDPGHKSYSLSDLQNMPMSEYAKIRGQLGVGQAAQNQRGLYS